MSYFVLLDTYASIHSWLYAQQSDLGAVATLTKFALGCVVLLPPTICVGARLPMMAQHWIRSEHASGDRGATFIALVAATGVGAGDLATATLTGAHLGTAILWAVLIGAGLKFVLNEALTRWQLATAGGPDPWDFLTSSVTALYYFDQ